MARGCCLPPGAPRAGRASPHREYAGRCPPPGSSPFRHCLFPRRGLRFRCAWSSAAGSSRMAGPGWRVDRATSPASSMRWPCRYRPCRAGPRSGWNGRHGLTLVGGLMVAAGALVPLAAIPMIAVRLVAVFTVLLPNRFSSISLLAPTRLPLRALAALWKAPSTSTSPMFRALRCSGGGGSGRRGGNPRSRTATAGRSAPGRRSAAGVCTATSVSCTRSSTSSAGARRRRKSACSSGTVARRRMPMHRRRGCRAPALEPGFVRRQPHQPGLRAARGVAKARSTTSSSSPEVGRAQTLPSPGRRR